MRNLPGPGLEPVSPALAGGFPTTATREALTSLILNRVAKVVHHGGPVKYITVQSMEYFAAVEMLKPVYVHINAPRLPSLS